MASSVAGAAKRSPRRTASGRRGVTGRAGRLRPLPDHLRPNLPLVFVGFNPGERSARLRHYYAGIGNLFWPALYRSGLVPRRLSFRDDHRLPEFGIGLTDLAKRPSRSAADLPAREFREGRAALRRKLSRVRPRMVAFNGLGAYRLFSGRACALGLQAEALCGARVFVLPSTSARHAVLPRRAKLAWFGRLKRALSACRPGPARATRAHAREKRKEPATALC